MRKKIKNLFSKIILPKRFGWLLFFAFSLSLCLTPLSLANAQLESIPIIGTVASWFVDAGLGISMCPTTILILAVGNILFGVGLLFSTFSVALLNWVIHLNIFLTKCADPGTCIVDIGWNFSRDLSNVLFIIVLVFIALSFILRIDTFGMKKALPMLLFVAVIMNFSQVFVGVIIDVAQIIMNTFLHVLDWESMFTQLAKNSWGGWNILVSCVSIKTAIFTIMKLLVTTIFSFILGLVFLSYVLLFIVRIIALWILTILAPLAFVSLILPMTKSWFSKWVNLVLSWAFMGVIALFFLTLAFYLLGTINNVGFKFASFNFDDPFGVADFLKSILPFIVVLYFMRMGYNLAKSTAPEAAKAVMAGVEKIGKLALAAAGIAAGAGAIAAVGKIGLGTRAAMQKMATQGSSYGQGDKGVGGWAKRRTSGTVGGWARRKVAGAAIEGVERTEDVSWERERKRAKEENYNNNARAVASQTTSIGKSSVLVGMAESKDGTGQIQDLIKNGVVKPEELEAAYRHALERGKNEQAKAIAAATTRVRVGVDANGRDDANANLFQADAAGNVSVPLSTRLAKIKDEITEQQVKHGIIDADDQTGTGGNPTGLTRSEAKDHKSFYEKLVDGMDPEKAGKGWQKDKAFMEAATKFWGGAKWAEAGRTLGREFEESLIKFNDEHGGIKWYIDNKNVALPRYLASSGAASLGLSPMEGATTTEEIKTRLEESKIASMSTGPERMQAEIKMYQRQLGDLNKIEGKTSAQNAQMQVFQNEITRRKIALGPADETILEEMNRLSTDAKKIKDKAEKIDRDLTSSEQSQVSIIEGKREALRRSLGGRAKPVPPPPPPPPPGGPGAPPPWPEEPGLPPFSEDQPYRFPQASSSVPEQPPSWPEPRHIPTPPSEEISEQELNRFQTKVKAEETIRTAPPKKHTVVTPEETVENLRRLNRERLQNLNKEWEETKKRMINAKVISPDIKTTPKTMDEITQRLEEINERRDAMNPEETADKLEKLDKIFRNLRGNKK